MLLVVFFLTLFVFQQVQASTTLRMENPSLNAASASANVLTEIITVYIYHLAPSGELTNPQSPVPCTYPQDVNNSNAYGCGNMDSNNDGIFPNNGIEYVVVDGSYLKDVIATEMNLAEITPDTEGEALKAQAVASRTVANWKSVYSGWLGQQAVNNSTTYQAFIPGAYNSSGYQSAIDKAIDGINGVGGTKGEFLQ